MDEKQDQTSRRELFTQVGQAGLVFLTFGPQVFAKPSSQKGEVDIFPTEDLMQEHELLNRILLIYEEGSRRLLHKKSFDPRPVNEAATIIRIFVEDYHEKNEENYVFPRFQKAGKFVDLIRTLKAQHDAGRALTTNILNLSQGKTSLTDPEGSLLEQNLTKFIRMYRPHESREGSVLFPAFRELVGERELKELGEEFEKREHELLGQNGFEGAVERVAQIERALGIYDLSQFTPKP